MKNLRKGRTISRSQNLCLSDTTLTFDGQTSWTVFKTQFDVVSSTNGWTDFVKASQLVHHSRISCGVLQGIPADKLTELNEHREKLES
ncbi:hypothetical protein AVEN_37454-1 [Araneus ventricosus]|uniref:Uncharacterized protein n=1 Tax=Araneus ventricosus TaxID=182803 RepID=A0A4Y2FD98_ARAVE|nr:hypothetical protein AVEN_37454-1 [Araneus ventricosus]